MYYIIRHGQTEKNKEKTLQGRSNAPLNESGKEQARLLGKYFAEKGIKFDAVYSSPLIRAVETARMAAGEDFKFASLASGEHTKIVMTAAGEDTEIIIDQRLIEMDYGPYEGLSLNSLPPEVLTFFSDFVHNPAPKGMEPLASVTARMGEFLEEIHDSDQENVLISVHAISMKGALEYLTPQSAGAYWSKFIPNCGVYQFEKSEKGYTVPEEMKY